MPRIVILMYHSISEPQTNSEIEQRYFCPPSRFQEHLEFLRSRNFRVISMDALNDYLDTGEGLQQDSIVLTFDDGFRDNYEVAWPILKAYGYPATVFVATRYVRKPKERPSERTMFMKRDTLDWQQLREMTNSAFTVGAHTVNHPKLTELPSVEATKEIVKAKQQIEDHIKSEVTCFAYPYGLYSVAVQRLVRQAGYVLACSTRSGFNNANTDPYALRRIEVYGTDPVWKLSQKIKFGTTNAAIWFPLKYYAQRVKARLL